MNPKKIETKVIIIGAGPAGSATSIFLSKYQIPHIVLEKDLFPRDKICGDACSGRTALVIERANPEWLKELLAGGEQHLPSWGMKIVAPNGKALAIPFTNDRSKENERICFTSPRLVFDNFLFEKTTSAYCTVFQEAIIRSVERSGNKVIVRATVDNTDYEYSAPMIVGADGDKSIVRKQFLSANELSKSYAVGLRGYYHGVAGTAPDNNLELFFLPELMPSYLWIFPLPNGRANVGVGIASAQLREQKINLREQMLNAIKNNPQLAPRFVNAQLEDKIKGWGLPLALQPEQMSGHNFILTGDAAGLIDPFTGEGIGNALYSGMLAADAIKTAIDSNDYSATYFAAKYDQVFYERLGFELKVSAKMRGMCKYPRLLNMLVNKAHKSKTFSKAMTSLFTDVEARRQFSKPSFYLKVLLNR